MMIFKIILKDSFNASFGVGKDGISKFNSEQIEAKANVLGLNKRIKEPSFIFWQVMQLFSAKAATGKLTYADAIKDSINNAPALAKALQKQGKLFRTRRFIRQTKKKVLQGIMNK